MTSWKQPPTECCTKWRLDSSRNCECNRQHTGAEN